LDDKILLVGLDGASWHILDRAIKSGHLPFLERICEDGVNGDLRSSTPPITPVAWPSFMTGVNPGKHGISGFAQPEERNGSYQFKMNDSRDIRATTIWEYLGGSGYTTVSLNLPMTFPAFEVNGVLVGGLFTPNMGSDFVYPAEFKYELKERGYKPFVKHVAGDLKRCISKAEYKKKVDEMWELVETKFEQAYYVDGEIDWDVFFLQIQELDAIQHFLLGFFEEGHPWYDEEMAEYIYEKFYGNIDEALVELIEKFDDGGNLTFLFVSDHGFQTAERAIYMGNWLHDHGFAEVSMSGTIKRQVINKLKRLDVLKMRRYLEVSRHIAKQKEAGTFDWETSAAISIGAGNNPIVPIYVLEDGSREQILSDLEDALNGYVDPETGDQVVKETMRGEDIYEGPHLKWMPDLIVKATDRYTLRTSFHPEEPIVADLVETTNRPGIHHPTGIIAGDGPDIASGTVDATLQDIFPTLLYYLGEPIPEYVDGTVLEGLFTPALNESTDPEYVAVPKERDRKLDTVLTNADEEDVRDTLSKLGYID
jgi:predicted AlkP superfamily phosphohydrolase/phosphomutase